MSHDDRVGKHGWSEGRIDIATMWFLRGLGGLLLGSLVVVVVAGLVPYELDGIHASYSGIRGQVENIQCADRNECHADFIGDDGTRITDVRLNGLSKSRTSYSRARVSSAQATAAWPDSRFNGVGLVVLALVLTAAGCLAVFGRNSNSTTSRHRRLSGT
ncbi:hypothetical protein GCM10022255_044810 [Dactylosporangium darangshiense]|uniref:Uncharacterized protein n=2 Tax=Dactylosporangium darangshiense TaxID=579108 RepID=A0ABP8DAW6_9ACTN